MAIIVLLQRDLRLLDNPALYYAVQHHDEVLPVYVEEEAVGAASAWWRLKSVTSLKEQLAAHGLPLLYCKGAVAEIIQRLQQQIEITDIYWNDCGQDWLKQLPSGKAFAPNLLFPSIMSEHKRDQQLDNPAHLIARDYTAETSRDGRKANGELAQAVRVVREHKRDLQLDTPALEVSKVYKVFTPYWRNCLQNLTPPAAPLPKPEFKSYNGLLDKFSHEEYAIPTLSGAKWWRGMEEFWQVGESAALERAQDFITTKLAFYASARDIPGLDGTSRLSPHLHFGELSVRKIWYDLERYSHNNEGAGLERFKAEIGWREFSYHLLCHNPNLPSQPLRENFANFPWRQDTKLLQKWQKGETGYPIIDAGMRQLWQTGWMHNRVRMIVGSFLVKNLLIPWQDGASWFLDTLIDADIANNSAGWQWVAGCGTDSTPYFRIFNPVLQGQKFDPEGKYIRRWIPELANISDSYIHTPWLVPHMLKAKSYPDPIVDLEFSRKRALAAYQEHKANLLD